MAREEIEDMGHGVRLVEDEDGDTALEVDGEIVWSDHHHEPEDVLLCRDLRAFVATIVRIASERDAARRERDELAAQLAALREAALIHQSTAHLWDREVSSAEGFAESMGTLIDADSRLCEALAASAPAAESYTRRVQADALESAADDVCDHEQLAEGRTLAAERSSLQRWLRARAAEIRGGR